MIQLIQKQQAIQLRIDADIINTSGQNFDLEALKTAIIKQLQTVFTVSVGHYDLSILVNVTVLKHVRDCSPKKILFQIVDSISGNNPAEAVLKGMRIKLNKNVIDDIIHNRNQRTIAHEIGHLLGWNHPHANATFESINANAHSLEQQLSESERQHNLMSQTWYAQKANVSINRAIKITPQQIEVLQEYSQKMELNKNYHLNYFWFWKKLA